MVLIWPYILCLPKGTSPIIFQTLVQTFKLVAKPIDIWVRCWRLLTCVSLIINIYNPESRPQASQTPKIERREREGQAMDLGQGVNKLIWVKLKFLVWIIGRLFVSLGVTPPLIQIVLDVPKLRVWCLIFNMTLWTLNTELLIPAEYCVLIKHLNNETF